jgi:hypothetical protein
MEMKMKKNTKKQLVAKVGSIGELRRLSREDLKYRSLAMIAAENLGGGSIDTVEDAFKLLNLLANETTEDGVVAEINACRDLL